VASRCIYREHGNLFGNITGLWSKEETKNELRASRGTAKRLP
jgi:hypothetical protein